MLAVFVKRRRSGRIWSSRNGCMEEALLLVSSKMLRAELRRVLHCIAEGKELKPRGGVSMQISECI